MSAAPQTARPARAWAAVWGWLRYGRRHGSRGFSFYRAPRATPWAIPARVWHVFRRQQRVELTPIAYVIVVAAGLAIGVVLRLALGLWWWMPGAVLLAPPRWLPEAGSAFWGGRWGRHPYTWRTELLAAISPQRGGLARHAEDRAKLLSSGLPFFAPVNWAGRLSFGGWGGKGGEINTVSIVCLPPGQEFSRVRSTSLTRPLPASTPPRSGAGRSAPTRGRLDSDSRARLHLIQVHPGRGHRTSGTSSWPRALRR